MQVSEPKDDNIQKHPTLHFADGDIALSAPLDATSKQVFLVHRALLSHYSEVFRDMFIVASGMDARHYYGEVPLADLPDRAGDVAELLEIIYSAS